MVKLSTDGSSDSSDDENSSSGDSLEDADLADTQCNGAESTL